MIVFQLELARRFYKNIQDEKTCIIPNPYLGDPVKRLDLTNHREKTIVLAAARLEYEKGFDVGIKAMKRVIQKHKDYRLLIYGKGDFNKMYGPLINEMNLSKYIEYKGLSDHIIDEIKDCSVFVLPSRSEGIPNMLLEALGAGIPCVAANCPPGGPEILLQNDRGILVPVDDYVSLGDAICKLLDNEYLANAYALKGQEVVDIFSSKKISEKWQECFENVISRCSDEKY